jgi:hypothetical protein
MFSKKCTSTSLVSRAVVNHFTAPLPRAWPLNSPHAPAPAAPALRCGCTLVCTPRQVFQNKKNEEFSSPTMCSARDAVDSGNGARALVRFRHARAKIWWLCRALLPAVHAAPTVSLHTHFVDSMRFKKTPKGHSPGKCRAGLAALQPPFALCFAGGRGCYPLAPLPLIRRAPFLASLRAYLDLQTAVRQPRQCLNKLYDDNHHCY